MNKIILAIALALGVSMSAPAFARDHHHGGGDHHNGGSWNHKGGRDHRNDGWNHRNDGWNHRNDGWNQHRRPPFPFPNPYPYPNPYPRPYPGTPAPVTVLVTEYCYGQIYTHFVTAYWDRYRGGWWYYDCEGRYRRAR